jgi:gliding motility-associated-like protein
MMMITETLALLDRPFSLRRILGKVFVLCSLLALGVEPAQATHIVGGDITYRCLGNNEYEVRLRVRRDCFLGVEGTEFDDPAAIGFFAADHFMRIFDLRTPLRTDDTLNQTFISDCTISGNDVCVEETVYIDTVTLPFYEPGYIIAYQRCCRNATLQNVFDPLNTGMTITTLLTAEAQMMQNSSPTFGEFPPIYICVDKPISFDMGVSDVEGDSLVYELFSPFIGATDLFPKPQPTPRPPYDTIVWNAPYSLENLLGGSDPIRIDPQTGVITGTPVLIGQFLIGVRVSAYSNGVLTSVVTREWQYNVRACREVPVSDFDVPLLTCNSLELHFTELTLHADEYLWIFNYGDSASVTSSELNPTYTFPGEGFYDVALIVNDADSICFDTVIQTVGVFESMINAEFDLEIPDCNTEIVLHPMDQSDDPNPDHDIEGWQWIITYPGVSDTAYAQNPDFVISDNVDSVLLTLLVTSSNGCTAETSATFDVNIINVPFESENLTVCFGDMITLVDGDPAFTYSWSPTETLDLSNPASPVASPTENTTYYVTVTDGICVVTDSVHVTIQDLPVIDLPGIDTSCFGAPVVLNPDGNPSYLYEWSPAGSLNDPNVSNPIAEVDSTTTFYVTVTDPLGEHCSIVDSTIVFVPPDIDLGEPNDTAYCDSPEIILTAMGSGLEYTWYTSGGAVIGTGPEITVQPEEETTYILEGQDIYGCEVQTTVTLTPTFFDLTITDDQLICVGETVTLSVTNNTAQNLTYQWIPGGSTDPVLTVSPTTTTVYTVLITNADLGCETVDSIEVFVGSFDPDFLDIFISDDTITLGESYILSTNQDPEHMFMWSGPGIIDPTLPVISATPVSAGSYSYAVTVTNEFGCILTGVISSLTVLNPECNAEDIFVPDAFSPNGDGFNDELFVYGNFITSMELRIFNRWGEQVFVTTDQSIGWDGKFKGKDLPPGVFGYYLRATCPPDQSYFTKGNITLLK